MASTVLGLVIDSSTLIDAERRGLTAKQALQHLQGAVGAVPVVLSAVTVAEIGHGIYRARTAEVRDQRRRFLDDLVATMPVQAVTARTAEIVARVGGEQASLGINLPFTDLLIGACALELDYAVATSNLRDFERIPGLTVIRL